MTEKGNKETSLQVAVQMLSRGAGRWLGSAVRRALSDAPGPARGGPLSSAQPSQSDTEKEEARVATGKASDGGGLRERRSEGQLAEGGAEEAESPVDLVEARARWRAVEKRRKGRQTRLHFEAKDNRLTEEAEEYPGEREDNYAVRRMTDYFKGIPDEKKDRRAFQSAVGLFLRNNAMKRGHVEFIYAAMSMLKEFGVEKELDIYKELMDLFPKGGKLVPTNWIQADLLHYPRDQECAIRLIDEMEEHGVLIDKEFSDLVSLTFGTANETAKKIQRLAYWQTKTVNLNPRPTPRILPSDGLTLAQMAVKHMCPDPVNKVTTFLRPPDPAAAFQGWIVSGMSPFQVELIRRHDEAKPLYVDGPRRVWVRYAQVEYFVLSAEPNPERDFSMWEEAEETEEAYAHWRHKYNWGGRRLWTRPSVHEQKDGTVLAVAATSDSSKDSAAAWVAALADAVPRLRDLPVVFRLSHSTTQLQTNDQPQAPLAKV